MLTITNEDNMVMMARYPDKHFDLAIVDPPYGIGPDWKKRKRSGRILQSYGGNYTNKQIPSKEYFTELMRVSKNQIIFGYNYFVEHLGPTNNLIVWDKESSNNNVFRYSKCEIAFSSFKIPCDIVRCQWDGSRMGKETGLKKIHPHQRPVELHKILLSKFAKKGDKILDTHLGSGSIAIACHDYGFDLTACELDKDYYDAAMKRINNHMAQTKLF